jgi:hypothetical protein
MATARATSQWDLLFRRFRVARVGVRLRALGDGPAPPFPGAALRGSFGRALRRAACATGAPSCEGCPLAARCAYGYLFETPVPAESVRMRRYPYAPHPMVLRPPAAVPSWRAGDAVDLELVLFGRGIDYLPFALYALGEMAREGLGPARVPLHLERADLLGARPVPLYDGATLAPGPHGRAVADEVDGARGGEMALAFVSPTRIVFGGAPARELPFHVVVRSLLRRVSSLAYFHEGVHLDLDFADLVARAARVPLCDARLRWVDQRRHSARQGRPLVMGGAVGEVRYGEVPDDLAPLVALGALTHVGKGTAFGMGQYQRRVA